MPWKKKWKHTPVFLPGESHGQRNLAGYSLWGLERVGQDIVTKPRLPHGRDCKVFSLWLNHGMPRYLVKHFVCVCSMFLDKNCIKICLLSKAVVLLSVGVLYSTSWQPEKNKNVEERRNCLFLFGCSNWSINLFLHSVFLFLRHSNSVWNLHLWLP